MHDIGALSLKEKMEALKFEAENVHKHAEVGYLLLKTFKPLADAASLIRFHHVQWDYGAGAEFNGNPVPVNSHILHLADRIAVSINKQYHILEQVDFICDRIRAQSGKMFIPEFVDAFVDLAVKQCFWLDAVSPIIDFTLSRSVNLPVLVMKTGDLIGLTRIFSQIIDFRSRFTATHSSGVAGTGRALAKLFGFSERECQMIEIAGYLHDLGKLAVPNEILDKKGKLTKSEFNIIMSHTFFTYRSLERIGDLDTINTWASFHHERLDGKGYPFHHTSMDLPIGSRILAVADVFTAITEDRPYRKGMSSEEALQTIQSMAGDSILDAHIVEVLKLNFDEINSLRITAQTLADEAYKKFFASS